MDNTPSFVYINSTNMLMPTAVLTKQILMTMFSTVINIFFDQWDTAIFTLLLTVLGYAFYSKFIEMEKTTQYLIQMDHMRQNEWEKMMRNQSKICTELKKEFDKKLEIYKIAIDKKLNNIKNITVRIKE